MRDQPVAGGEIDSRRPFFGGYLLTYGEFAFAGNHGRFLEVTGDS
jgi:hypothetical protein